tara:strand:+ start:369 stop:1142 length:774 start_codon:yes stop_codon:yes gene_type:complete
MDIKNLASKGRFGDTQLRFVDGELSHVNLEEAKTIDMYGSQGEKLVKSIGSGTINPETGLKENWLQYVVPAIAAVSYVVGTISESSAGATKEKQANIKADAAQEQKINLYEQIDETKTLEASEKEVMNTQYLNKSYMLGDKSIDAYTTAKSNVNTQIGKSNFAYGTADKKFEDFRQDLTSKMDTTRDSLWETYSQKISDIEVNYEGQRSSLENQITQLDYEQELASAESEQWYPWKYTSKAIKTLVPGGDPGYTTQV